MARRLKSSLFSLQARLVIAMTALILLAVVATGVVFVLRDREASERRELDSIAASAPAIFQTAARFDVVIAESDTPQAFEIGSRLDRVASERALRILLVDETGVVLHDSGDSLQGTVVSYPVLAPADLRRGFAAWKAGEQAADYTFVASAPPSGTEIEGRPVPFVLPVGAGGDGPVPYGMVLGVETARLENAWLNALPGVGIAAAIATPFAVILAVVLARQIARPIHQLTVASEAMALGDFDQRVEVNRRDEVGRLAAAFSVMAERVGERDTQMRELIANVSHDLKTPMTSIIGYAQAVRDGVADDAGRAAEVIHRQATLAHELLADLLFLSEIDSEQVIRRDESAAASDLLEQAAARCRPLAEAGGVRLGTEADATVTCSGIDTERTVRALTNLIDNAVKFSTPGAAVRLRVARNGEMARFDVENDGPPVPADDLPHIFERFYRGRDDPGSHGLGLAIAREAVVLSGGRIETVNLPRGPRFSVYLPLASGAADTVGGSSPDHEEAASSAAPGAV